MNIYIYIIRRILYAIPIVLCVCLVIFILFEVAMPDPALTLLDRRATTEQIEELREELGLNRSYILQYFDIVYSAFTFDFGRSWSTKQTISSMIRQGAIPSATVTIPGFFISTILGVFISLIIGLFRGRSIDKIFVFVCVLLMSISSLTYILFGQWFFGFYLEIFEISGYESGFPDFAPYVILPILIYVILSIGPNVRFFRSMVLDELYQDYVRTGRSKGLSESRILLKHVLKNIMIPLITYVVISLPFLILGTLLLESFFNIPGLGSMTLSAVNAVDFPVLKAITIISSMLYVIFSIITDVLYTIVDPRIQLN